MRFAVKILVDVDEDDVVEDPETGTITCGTTGDTYDTFEEFFEHQLSRDLQCIEILPGLIVQRKAE